MDATRQTTYIDYYYYYNDCLVLLSPKTPLVGERSFKVYCILSNAEITCSPDQKAAQESVKEKAHYNARATR